jgi:hypothetical protein
MGIETPSQSPAMALASTWSAIHEAAATVGMMADIEPCHLNTLIDRGLRTRFGRHGEASRHDVQDLADVMQRGIAALLAAHTSGGAPRAAAQALWAEFLAGRDAITERIRLRASTRRT